MSGTMMQHGARVPIEVLKFNSRVLFSSEKSFTLSPPIQTGTSKKEVSYFLVKSHKKCYWDHCPRSMVLYVFSF